MRFEIQHKGPSSRSGQSQTFDVDHVVVGRSRQCDLGFDPTEDKEVSGKHGEFLWVAGRLTYRDVGSTNGSFLNSAPVTGSVHVHTGDIIQLGKSGPQLHFTLVEGSAPAEVLDATIPGQLLAETLPGPVPAPASGRAPAAIDTDILQQVAGAAAQQSAPAPVVVRRGGWAGWLVAFVALGTLGVGGYFAREELNRVRAEGGKRAEEVRFASELLGRVNLGPLLSQGIGEEQAEAFDQLEGRYQSILDEAREVAANDELAPADKERELEDLQVRLNTAAEELAALQEAARKPGDWSQWAAAYGDSIFLVVVQHYDSKNRIVSQGTGTAFVVDESGVLGTNAHVARMLQGPGPEGSTSMASTVIQNGSGLMFDVVRWVEHPEYDEDTSDTADVALIWFKTEHDKQGPIAMQALPLAPNERVLDLAVGEHLGTLGFPGELSSEYLKGIDAEERLAPGTVATFKDGWVTKVTDFQGQVGNSADARYLIHHSASLSGGTSGSPMFDPEGRVVALNNAGYSINLEDIGLRTPSASELGQGVRVDLLRGLMNEHIE